MLAHQFRQATLFGRGNAESGRAAFQIDEGGCPWETGVQRTPKGPPKDPRGAPGGYPRATLGTGPRAFGPLGRPHFQPDCRRDAGGFPFCVLETKEATPSRGLGLFGWYRISGFFGWSDRLVRLSVGSLVTLLASDSASQAKKASEQALGLCSSLLLYRCSGPPYPLRPWPTSLWALL